MEVIQRCGLLILKFWTSPKVAYRGQNDCGRDKIAPSKDQQVANGCILNRIQGAQNGNPGFIELGS